MHNKANEILNREKHLYRLWSRMKAFQSPAVLYKFSQSDKRHQGYGIYFVKEKRLPALFTPRENTLLVGEKYNIGTTRTVDEESELKQGFTEYTYLKKQKFKT